MRKKIKFPPRIFYVNWFRKDAEGKYLWPGYGENMRVLKWIVDRCQGEADADETPLGWVPGPKKFDLTGLPGFSEERFNQLRSISYDDWRREIFRHDEWFLRLYASAQGTGFPAGAAGGAVVARPRRASGLRGSEFAGQALRRFQPSKPAARAATCSRLELHLPLLRVWVAETGTTPVRH